MKITQIETEKKRYLPLLLLADEQESMIDRYLARGEMYVMNDGEAAAVVCVVTDEGDGVLEIKNLATAPESRRKGLARSMIDFISEKYGGEFHTLLVGTGESPLTVPFYEKCGFTYSHRIKDFFTENYENPIFECGVRLTDMVYLKKKI